MYKKGIKLYKEGKAVGVYNKQDYKNYLSWGYKEQKQMAKPKVKQQPAMIENKQQEKTLIDIAQSRPDVMQTAKAQGGDPFTSGTAANRWLNDWWNTAGRKEYQNVKLIQPTVKKQQAIVSPSARGTYGELTQKGKTVYTKTGEAFQTPAQLAGYLGIKPSEIDWTKIGEKLTTTETPKLPAMEASNVIEDYTAGLMANVEKKRTALEQERQKQLEIVQRKIEESQKKIEEWTAKQEDVFGKAEPLTAPFREELERTERERLKIEENFFENQKIVEEIDSLLTDIQTKVRAEKERTGLAAIRNPRIQKAAEEAAARVGVLEASMASRNNQIAVAENLIDRSMQAITADRIDRLNYYNSLLDFYQNSKDEEGNKLFRLSQKEDKFIKDNISLLENDLANAQANANYIKELMLNPETASLIAKSGVTLNDTPQQVMKKFADYEYSNEVRSQISEMSLNGYQLLTTPEQIASKDKSQLVHLTDSKGVERVYYMRPEFENKLLSPSEAAYLGVPYGTTQGQAAAMGITPARWKGIGISRAEEIQKLDLTTPEGIARALESGKSEAEIRSILDAETKLTMNSINSLIEAGKALIGSNLLKLDTEIEKTAKELVALGDNLNDLNYSVAITKLIDKFGFDESAYDSFSSEVNKKMEKLRGEKTTEETPPQDFFKTYFPTGGIKGAPEEVGKTVKTVAMEAPPKVWKTVAKGISDVGAYAKGIIRGLLQ